jgi:hypothetical protein
MFGTKTVTSDYEKNASKCYQLSFENTVVARPIPQLLYGKYLTTFSAFDPSMYFLRGYAGLLAKKKIHSPSLGG